VINEISLAYIDCEESKLGLLIYAEMNDNQGYFLEFENWKSCIEKCRLQVVFFKRILKL